MVGYSDAAHSPQLTRGTPGSKAESGFQTYSRRLNDSLFADSVMQALWRIKRSGAIDSEARKCLKHAEELLTEAMKGIAVLPDVFHASQDRKEFINYLDDLRKTVLRISDGKRVSDKKIEKLNAFFFRYSQAQFKQTLSMLELM